MNEQMSLYHFPICPFCRKIRFMLEYTGASRICALRIENFWERREKFCNINPTGEVPFLAVQKFEDGQKKHLLIWGQNSIMDYLRKKYPVDTLIFGDIGEQANIMKYSEWFDTKFYNEAVKPILNERVYTYYKKKRNPDLDLLRLARLNCEQHLRFIENILSRRDYIAYSKFSLADLSCAVQISSLDYLGEIDWGNHPVLKDWYVPIKSKPEFRDLLYDIIPDFRPSDKYRELDF
ncbi:MAG: glutathione S-transferase family protein [Rickettsiales bacterium]|nr:glutathione S-transferase family protein [Rickettsiales bacterium]MBR1429308.1 glutathione S-transferase family protein [Rickettsiales bacterium]